MNCSSCRVPLTAGEKFCTECGTPIIVIRQVAVPTEPIVTPEFQRIEDYVPPASKKKILIAMGLVLVLIVSGSMVFQKINAPRFLNVELTVKQVDEVASQICEDTRASVESSNEYLLSKGATKKTIALNRAADDYWVAGAFYDKHGDWFDQMDHYGQFNMVIATAISEAAPEVFAKYGAGNYLGKYEKNSISWNDDLFQPVVEKCNYSAIQTILTRYDKALANTKNSADNMPWYPKGFNEISSDSGVAYKNAGGSCSYSFGSCAHIYVISNQNCLSSLYIEANLLDGGVVVGWTNATARVAAYQIAYMSLDFTRYGSTYEITQVNCR